MRADSISPETGTEAVAGRSTDALAQEADLSSGREYDLSVDIGGTFTDIIVTRDDGRLYRAKVLSTFGELLSGIEAGLAEVLFEGDIAADCISKVVHASTVGTNTILEQKGAVAGLITTKGFRDVLEIGRLRRPSLYDVFWQKPPPLVRRSLRQEVDERVGADGSVQVALSREDAAAAIDALRAVGVDSLAVCLLHSYANPEHELEVGRIARERHPGLRVSLSHQVLPELREYERTSTTVINAYILPAIEGYLVRFTEVLEQLGIRAPVFMMQSSGGIVPAALARERPVSIVESGPAAGALATGFMASQVGIANAIAFDMGGTTAKACVVQNGAPEMAFEYEVGAGTNAASPLLRGGGYALRGPAISIAEVGSGGGSIAWVDEGGAVQVGPESAGANPGPACYDRGGMLPTVTDANVVLGYVDPVGIAGGRLRIDRGRADEAIRTCIAERLNLGTNDAALGIHVIANENMARAVRAVTTERGRDPREFTLVAFGGSGPVHAAGLALSIGIQQVVIPLAAGLFSALGLLFSDVRNDFVASVMSRLDEADAAELRHRYKSLVEQAQHELGAALEGGARGTRIHYLADVRYVGQSFELSVEIPDVADDLLSYVRDGFERDYERLYGRLGTGALEVVNIRVSVVAPVKRVSYRDLGSVSQDSQHSSTEERMLYFGETTGHLRAPVMKGRHALASTELEGPAVIEEPDTTILVPPNCRAKLDEMSNVVISVS